MPGFDRRAPAMALAVLAVLAAPAAAQTIGPWDDPARAGTVALDVQSPAFQYDGFDNTTVLVFLTTRWMVKPGVALVAELPFEHTGVDDLFGQPAAATVIGNPYVGIEVGAARIGIAGELGFRLPLVSDPGDARERFLVALTAFWSDYDRFEAFLDDVWSVRARLGYRWRSPAGVTLGGAVGPTLVIGGDESFVGGDNLVGAGTETAIDYRLQVGYDGPGFTAGAVFTGRYFPGEPGGLLAALDGPVHQLAFGAGALYGKTRPTVFMRFPLDRELGDALRFIVGLGVSVTP